MALSPLVLQIICHDHLGGAALYCARAPSSPTSVQHSHLYQLAMTPTFRKASKALIIHDFGTGRRVGVKTGWY